MTTDGKPVARFSLADAQLAGDAWGANCGPGALAAITGRTLEEVRAHLDGFDRKRYTNPTMMYAALRSLNVHFQATRDLWPKWGLVRVQWEGPWTAPGVPMKARYRHTHWVGAQNALGQPGGEVFVFDINCMCVGGWVPLAEWAGEVVPWLLRECEPKANGKWHATHRLEIEKPKA